MTWHAVSTCVNSIKLPAHFFNFVCGVSAWVAHLTAKRHSQLISLQQGDLDLSSHAALPDAL